MMDSQQNFNNSSRPEQEMLCDTLKETISQFISMANQISAGDFNDQAKWILIR
jgi:hypothetical protein